MHDLFIEEIKNTEVLNLEQKNQLIRITSRLPKKTVGFLSSQLETDPSSIVLFLESCEKKREVLKSGDISQFNSILKAELHES